ncbi:Beta-barrel assembly machine subunit BamE [Rhodovulum imhoffii]|uniref:Beta-barrel assembly machine subunit BamE n=1 Tax=Rhodovulum imhoffii TaxID=365340 RepID=A0A2T5BVM6_9RHOB|nr:outer membrane protein assembly factor BamE [Rhodovulum imhoffii]MBK5932803.1 cell envelope protein SmpA [Rhodovulum imhoffii]PTN03628.1 Beta-barrel assembly machine subunit BamE [Rhodovulum imhoffii]
MRKPAGIGKLAIAGILAAALAGCSPIYRKHGYAPSEEDLSEIVVGVDTRDTVAGVIGPPAASGVQNDGAWYYVSSNWRTVGYRAPEETDRQVVAISFDGTGTVRNIERFGLKDGRVIALNRRVTDENVQGISFLRQLLGNIGQFTTDQIVD